MKRCLAIILFTGAVVLSGGCGAVTNRVSPAPEPLMRQVADRVLLDYPDPPPFDWGEGVLMAGMMRAGTVLNEPRYIRFVQNWADHWYAKGVDKLLPTGPLPQLQGYCGYWGPGYPVMLLHEKTGDPRYLEMVRQIADYIMTQATRTKDGGLGHWSGNYQLWVDTLYMVGPPFAHLSKTTGDPKYLNEAVRQLNIYQSHTQEPGGLFWHMYDEPSGKRMGTLWARGNGWVAMTYVMVLARLDAKAPEYARLLGEFRRLMDALLATQCKQTYMWHTVVDHSETYLETSATAMILSAMVEADRCGLYPLKDRRLVRRTWASLATKISEDGHVIDVSGGTMPQDLQVYATKLKGTFTWGTGAFLMAASLLEQ